MNAPALPETRLLELGGTRCLLVPLFRPVTAPLSALTDAERSVVEAALEGRSNAEIAAARQTSVRTIANQLSSAYAKLGVRSRGALAKKLADAAGTESALASGRWRLVERVESNQKRWAIAWPLATPLSESELRVVALRARGLSLAVIAAELGVSEATASRRARAALEKLGVASVAELASVWPDAQGMTSSAPKSGPAP